MVILNPILCPVDFSEHSRHALRWAGALARRHESRVIVVSAVDPLLADAARTRLGLDLATTETAPALRTFIAETWPDETSRPAHTTRTHVGDPPDVILQTAASERAGLIVMGTQGLGGVRKWLLGSTTERVLRRSQTPVLAVPGPEQEVPEVSAAALASGPILVATDFSGTAEHAVTWAADLARRVGTPLLIAHVVEPISVPPQWHAYVHDTDEARVAAARAKLEQVAAPMSGAQACEIIATLGRPADSIAALAAQRQVSVIVMGLASDEGPFAPRPGSIAYRVLALARTPVLVVPPEDTRK